MVSIPIYWQRRAQVSFVRVVNYQKTPKPVPVSPLVLLTSLHLGWYSKLITVGLRSMWVLQGDKSGCKDPLFIYFEEGNWAVYGSNIQLCEYFSTSGVEVGCNCKALWVVEGWSGSKIKKWKKTHWTSGPGLGPGMKLGENMKEIHPNCLIMSCSQLISKIWLLQVTEKLDY